MVSSYVVTGGGRGIGRAVVERLLDGGAAVVALERDEAALAWTRGHTAGARVLGLAGDAADEAVTERAADLAERAGPLAGWVNNAAVFSDADLHAGAARVLAVDYGPSGVRVNAVALGTVATGRPLDEAALGRLHPLGRVGTVEEVAAAVAWLLGPEASFVSGAVVPVDGGRSALGVDPEARDPIRPS